MGYDPDKHQRRSLRLPHYDYASSGAYFITICVHQRQCLFGEIVDGMMRLNKWGTIAQECWQAIPDHFAQVQLDEWVIMPNHVHCLFQPLYPLKELLKTWKGVSARRIGQGSIWQRNYRDRLIRNSEHFESTVLYIRNNPKGLASDQFTLWESRRAQRV